MRVELHEVGSVMHLMNRGARGLPIVRDEADRKNFLRSLFYLNDTHQDRNWRKTLRYTDFPKWPRTWPERNPLVDLWAWTLMPNHFHCIIREKIKGGTAKFMQRFCGSLSAYANTKYNDKGSLFQGGYKGRVVGSDADLRWLASYVMVKNTLELYPGGLTRAIKKFNSAWEWGLNYPFSSMQHYGRDSFPSMMETEENMIISLFKNGKSFKGLSYDMLVHYTGTHKSDTREALTLEAK